MLAIVCMYDPFPLKKKLKFYEINILMKKVIVSVRIGYKLLTVGGLEVRDAATTCCNPALSH